MSTINIKGREYEVIKNIDGFTSLKRYNEKAKMWVKVSFAQEKNIELETTLIKMLSNIYIEKVTGIIQ